MTNVFLHLDPPFRRVAIAGLGLIGGSIALGIRERWPAVPDCRHRSAGGAGARAWQRRHRSRPATTADGLGDVDLVILAAPVRQNVALLGGDCAHGCRRRQSSPTSAGPSATSSRRRARCRCTAAFVGGHPIGGAERGGFGFARPDLFKGRPWIFTPARSSPAPIAVERLFDFARGLGARPSAMDAAEHDRVMAFLSHLPQLAASALMEVIGTAAARGRPAAGGPRPC